jgi:cohesin complex subunit SCC1
MAFEQVIAKKGPLSHVWLAAHWEKKLTKQQVNETNIVETVDEIKSQRVQLALRLSGHLLLGVVRIYFRKVDYLFTDCYDALGKLKKLVFSPGTVNIDESVANLRNVTMPETVADFEVVLPGDISTQQIHDVEEGVFTMNLAKAADITLPSDELEHMRGQGRRSTLSRARQHELSISDIDIMNEEAPPDIALPGPEEGFELPDQEEERGFEFAEMGKGWEGLQAPEEEVELAIPDLPQRAPAAQVRGPRQRYVVDRSTELTNASIEKNINDPSSLLRKLQRAPHTQELLDLAKAPKDLFVQPAMPGLSPELMNMMRITMKPAGEIELPALSIETSELEGRRESEAEIERGASPYRVELDYGMPFPEEEEGLPLEDRTGVSKPEPSEQEEVPAEEIPSAERKVVITKRTSAMHEFLSRKFTEAGVKTALSFNSLFETKSRHAAAIAFFELLNIKSKDCIDVKQKEPYGDLLIKKTAGFNALTA